MNIEQIYNTVGKIRITIKDGKLSKAIKKVEELLEIIEEKSIKNKLILTCAKYNYLKTEKALGVMSDKMELNKVLYGLLDFIDEIEAYLIDSHETDQKNNLNILQSSISKITQKVQNYNSLTSEEKEKLYIQNLEFKKILHEEIDAKFKNDYPNIIFNRVFFSDSLHEIEVNEIRNLAKNDKYKWYEKSLVVSGVSLSLIKSFDPIKVDLLIDFLITFEERVWHRALVGVVLGTFNRDNKLYLYPNLIKRIEQLQEIEAIQLGLNTIANELRNETFKNCGDYFTFLETNSVEYFKKPENWFLPYYEDNPIIHNAIKYLPNIPKIDELPYLILKDRHLCNSEKYWIAQNLSIWNENQISALIKHLEEGKFCTKEHIYDPYIADFFWFYNKFSLSELEKVFTSKIEIYNTKLVDLLIPENRIFTFRARAELNKKNEETALVFFQNAIEVSPTDITNYCLMGSTLQRLGRFDDAIISHQKAYEIDSNHLHSLIAIAYCYISKEEFEKAQQYLLKFETESKEELSSWDLGISFYHAKAYSHSLRVFNKLYEEDPNDLRILANIGYCQILLKEFNSAKKNSVKTIEKENNEFGLKNLGHLNFIEGDYESAKKYYEQSLDNFESTESFMSILNEDIYHLESLFNIDSNELKQIIEELLILIQKKEA